METLALSAGFTDGPIQSADAFRKIMTAMACPGTIAEISGAAPPAPMSVAAGTAILTLCDPETPIYLTACYNIASVRDWISFHTGAPFTKVDKASFALGTWDELPLPDFYLGNAEYPDRSATLIVELERLENCGATLQGPGIQTQGSLSLPKTEFFAQNARQFPLGLDFIFTQGPRIAALPRTTRVS